MIRIAGQANESGDPKLKLKLPTVPNVEARTPKAKAPRETKMRAAETKMRCGETKIVVARNALERGRGRPKTLAEPWKAAGLSRAAWFRRQKAATKA